MHLNKIKISVIIPVYNCAEYLKQCVDSVLMQTLKDIEIICIEDESTDKSYDILQDYANKYERIYIYKQKNQGAGKARNHGIQKARGKYLAFLDADDYYVDRNALEKMVTLCEEKRVSVCGSLRKCLENGKEKTESLFQDIKSGRKELLERDIYQYSDFQMDYDYQSYLFNRELILKNNITFPDYRRFQDPPFMVQAMWHAREFVIADIYLYCYRKPQMAAKFTEAKTIDLIKGLVDNLRFADEHGLEKLFSMTRERLEYEYAGIIYHNISENSQQLLKLLSEANQIINQKSGMTEYVLHPLQRFKAQGVYKAEAYEKNLLDLLKEGEQFALYGAGKYAKGFLHYLETKHLKEKINKIVVSSLTDNAAELEGIPLISVKDFSDKCSELLVTLGGHFHKEIEDTLRVEGIKNYQFIDDVFLSELC